MCVYVYIYIYILCTYTSLSLYIYIHIYILGPRGARHLTRSKQNKKLHQGPGAKEAPAIHAHMRATRMVWGSVSFGAFHVQRMRQTRHVCMKDIIHCDGQRSTYGSYPWSETPELRIGHKTESYKTRLGSLHSLI